MNAKAFTRDLDAMFRAAPGPFMVPTQGTILALAEKHADTDLEREVIALRAFAQDVAEHFQDTDAPLGIRARAFASHRQERANG